MTNKYAFIETSALHGNTNFSKSVRGEKEEPESNSNSNSDLGCLLALVASLMWAGLMLTIRLASQSPRLPREASLLPATCLGSLLSVILVLPIGGDVFVTGE